MIDTRQFFLKKSTKYSRAFSKRRYQIDSSIITIKLLFVVNHNTYVYNSTVHTPQVSE